MMLFAAALSLFSLANEVREKAYCPYSSYKVGCALETKSGKVYTGCNVENASYGVAICSERCAVLKAVSDGEREFTRIAIVTRDGGLSCGVCRQVLNEFSPDMIVAAYNERGELTWEGELSGLLPGAFGPHNLQ